MAADVAGPATAGNPEHASLAESLHTVLTTLTQIRQLGAPIDLPELRERLVLASWLVTELSAAQDLLLAAYRSAGASWEEVAEATGRPAAQAQEAYSRRLASATPGAAPAAPPTAPPAAATMNGLAGSGSPVGPGGPTAPGGRGAPIRPGGPGGPIGPGGPGGPAGQSGGRAPAADGTHPGLVAAPATASPPGRNGATAT